MYGLCAWGVRPHLRAATRGPSYYGPMHNVDVAKLRVPGERFRAAQLPAPARPAALAGAAGQPGGGNPGAPGGPSTSGTLQPAAQGQAARCGEAAAGPERAPAAEAAEPERAPPAEEGPAAGPERAPAAEPAWEGAGANPERAPADEGPAAGPDRAPAWEGAGANPEHAPADERPAAAPERAPPAEGGTWLEVIYRLLKDLQPRRWLTCQEIARCAAEPGNAQSCCFTGCCLSSTSTSAWSSYISAGARAFLWAPDSFGACGFCGAFLLRVVPDWTPMTEPGCLALLGRLVQQKTMKASADPEKYVAKALDGDIKHDNASLFAMRDLEPTPGRNRHLPTYTS